MEDFVDHYIVLGLPSGEEGSKLSLKQIREAYLKECRIRHPDKRPDDPKATADFQLLTSSFEFLLDKVNRSNFDAKLRARRDAKLRGRREPVPRDSFQDAKRRKMATDLEERERSAAVAEEVRLKEKRIADEIKKEIAEIRARNKAVAYGQQKEENKVGGEKAEQSLDNDRILKVYWKTSARDYDAAKLRGIFESFGVVENVVLRLNSSKKKQLTLIEMTSREAAVLKINPSKRIKDDEERSKAMPLYSLANFMTANTFLVRAVQNMSGEIRTPLLVLPLEPIAPIFSDTTSTNQNESMGPGINNVVGAGFEEYEAFVMKSLQEASEKQKCMR